jgi:hypothetical protein
MDVRSRHDIRFVKMPLEHLGAPDVAHVCQLRTLDQALKPARVDIGQNDIALLHHSSFSHTGETRRV